MGAKGKGGRQGVRERRGVEGALVPEDTESSITSLVTFWAMICLFCSFFLAFGLCSCVLGVTLWQLAPKGTKNSINIFV